MHFGHSFKKTFLQALPSQHTFSARSGKPSPLKKNKKSRAHPGNADLFFVTESDSVHLRKAACTLARFFSLLTSRFLSLFFFSPLPTPPNPGSLVRDFYSLVLGGARLHPNPNPRVRKIALSFSLISLIIRHFNS